MISLNRFFNRFWQNGWIVTFKRDFDQQGCIKVFGNLYHTVWSTQSRSDVLLFFTAMRLYLS